MSRRFALTPAAAASGDWRQTIQLPPSAAPGAAACACANLGVAWSTGGDTAVMLLDDVVPVVLAASGTICPDTEWTLAPTWEPDSDAGAPPTIVPIGASAWAMQASSAGVLTLSVSASCGGIAFDLPPVTLVVIAGGYSAGGCALGDDWVNIGDLLTQGCASMDVVGRDDLFAFDGDAFFVGPPAPFYGGTPTPPATYALVYGLGEFVGRVDVRVTVLENSLDGIAYPVFVMDRTAEVAADIPDSWVSEDIYPEALCIGAGVGNGAGGSGSCSFRVEVRRHAG